jgi:surfactin synthase thioesterase subunit
VTSTVLVCLGFAGAGASFFRPWHDLAPPGLRIVAPQLPGREWLVDEEPPSDVGAAVEALLPDVLAATTGQRVALFGQCFGAVVAFELARRLTTVDGVDLVHLFPSGSLSPWASGPDWAVGADDDELVRRLRDDIGYSHDALAVPELRELILPALRADMTSHGGYLAQEAEPLTVPVTALRGRCDPVVSAAEAAGWARATTGRFALVEFDGAHMYLVDRADELLRVIASAASASP